MATTKEDRHIVTTVDDGIATITITNAGPLNLLNTPVVEDTTAAVAEHAESADVRALVLRGCGDRAFIGGADITEMVALNEDTAQEFISRLAILCDALRHFPVPVIARLRGWCLGAGLEIAAAADIRISGDDAHFGMPEVAVGIPSVIHAALLPRLIGTGRARWLMLTGWSIDATTAHSWGLVDEIHTPEELDTAIAATAGRFATLGPHVLRQQKNILRCWEDLPVDEAVSASVTEFGAAFTTGEPQRFMTEFLNRKHKNAQGRAAK